MKKVSFRNKPIGEIKALIKEAQKELLDLHVQKEQRKIKDVHILSKKRKDIARALSALREKELAK